jgi:hypothetical protein
MLLVAVEKLPSIDDQVDEACRARSEYRGTGEYSNTFQAFWDKQTRQT